jgi:hypothetical protein
VAQITELLRSTSFVLEVPLDLEDSPLSRGKPGLTEGKSSWYEVLDG